MPLQSEFKNNPQLVACAERDSAHIGIFFHPKGEHVTLIKKALNVWIEREGSKFDLAKLDMASDVYDKAVATAVYTYKARRNDGRILNYRGEVDDVVGIKTVAALDRELPVELGPVVVFGRVLVDVVVRLSGAPNKTLTIHDEEDVLSQGLVLPYLGKLVWPGKRKLLLKGFKTAATGEETKSERARILDAISAALDKDCAIGLVFVYGYSAGGLNAIDFGKEFNARFRDQGNGEITRIAVADIATYPNETLTVPNAIPNPTNVPEFNKGAIAAGIKQNFFQIAGNKSKLTLLSRRSIFDSDMAEKEVHGSLNGFQSIDLTSQSVATESGQNGSATRDARLHMACINAAFPIILGDIARTLNALAERM